LMTMRLSARSFAGTARTLVAVGSCSDAVMFFAIAFAAPRSGRTASVAPSPAPGCADLAGLVVPAAGLLAGVSSPVRDDDARPAAEAPEPLLPVLLLRRDASPLPDGVLDGVLDRVLDVPDPEPLVLACPLPPDEVGAGAPEEPDEDDGAGAAPADVGGSVSRLAAEDPAVLSDVPDVADVADVAAAEAAGASAASEGA